ncbi:hypothetical protein XENTR_v10011445 [Xenopus tropicalis]|nr:hypothetical protein XENTR_v10011445 [Xenopus tropicalis]
MYKILKPDMFVFFFVTGFVLLCKCLPTGEPWQVIRDPVSFVGMSGQVCLPFSFFRPGVFVLQVEVWCRS